MTLDDKVYEYTADFCRRTDTEVDFVALGANILILPSRNFIGGCQGGHQGP